MKRLLPLTALTFTLISSCGVIPLPRTVPLGVVAVTFPTTLKAGENLSVTVKYAVNCNNQDERLLLVTRKASYLSLEASATNNGQNFTCTPVYDEATLTYADSGTVARTNPFEIIVNGKSWGTVEVK